MENRMPTIPTNEEIAKWRSALPESFQLYLQKIYADGQNEGFQRGVKKAEKALDLNRILIPLCIVAFPAGLLLQRYFIGA